MRPTVIMQNRPGNFNEPHDICIGGSQNRVLVADCRNKRIQVFDQDGNFVAAWPRFGEVNSVFVSKDDILYAGTAYPPPTQGRALWIHSKGKV